jgi:hypothetical protein
MRPRDLVIVAAIGVLATLAGADALRSRGHEPAPVTAPATTETEPGESRATFDRVPAPGRIVFADGSCMLHEVDVASGRELPLPPIATLCDVWAAPRGEHVAYTAADEGRSLRIVSLNRPLVELGRGRNAVSVFWNPDGQLVAWCDIEGNSFALLLGEPRAQRLPSCPLGIAPNGFPVFRDPRGIRFGGRVVRTPSDVTSVSFGDGSMTLVLTDRIERRTAAGSSEISIPPRLSGRIPVVAPDGCAALYPVGGARIRIVDLCLDAAFDELEGTAAAWSPDGEWIGVVDRGDVVILDARRADRVVRWDVDARDVGWLG